MRSREGWGRSMGKGRNKVQIKKVTQREIELDKAIYI